MKLGDAYQDLVGEIQRALDPGASVDVGIWVEGPDGRRDCDVRVRGTVNGATRFILIECKDWAAPVGASPWNSDHRGVISYLGRASDFAGNAVLVGGRTGGEDV